MTNKEMFKEMGLNCMLINHGIDIENPEVFNPKLVAEYIARDRNKYIPDGEGLSIDDVEANRGGLRSPLKKTKDSYFIGSGARDSEQKAIEYFLIEYDNSQAQFVGGDIYWIDPPSLVKKYNHWDDVVTYAVTAMFSLSE
jgi:hypothetical protein